jgi:hypothetical protein
MNTTPQNTENTMSSTSNKQSVGREAPGSSVRSVNLNAHNDRFAVSRRQTAKARHIARQIDHTTRARAATVAPILAALAAFGGHIAGTELSAQ